MAEIKAGARTTEGWLAAIVAAVPAIVAWVTGASEAVQVAAIAAAAVVAVAYLWSRTRVKQGAVALLLVALICASGCVGVSTEAVRGHADAAAEIAAAWAVLSTQVTPAPTDPRDSAEDVAGAMAAFATVLERHAEALRATAGEDDDE